MTIFGISYQTYSEDTQWIVNLLGPATVAFAARVTTKVLDFSDRSALPQYRLPKSRSDKELTRYFLMTIFGISYQTYSEDTQWIVNLLGPATVAFAVPSK
jgi:putative effector of murein hydrolase